MKRIIGLVLVMALLMPTVVLAKEYKFTLSDKYDKYLKAIADREEITVKALIKGSIKNMVEYEIERKHQEKQRAKNIDEKITDIE